MLTGLCVRRFGALEAWLGSLKARWEGLACVADPFPLLALVWQELQLVL